MNKNDIERFARAEEIIINQGIPYRLSHLTEFPYKTLDELKNAHKYKEIMFESDFNGELLHVIGSKSDIVANMFWLFLPIIIVLADIVLAIVFKKWILLLGILFVLIGYLSSSPYNQLKNSVSGLGGLFFIGSFFFLDWTWSIIIGSMLFSQIFTLTAREQCRTVIKERALKSEIFFVYMLKNSYLAVRDTKTAKLYQAK